MSSIYDRLINELAKGKEELSDSDRKSVISALNKLENSKLNILLVGATGVGKSSTINAIFGAENAKVGYSVDPETKHTEKYEIGNNIVLWDTPGFGDSPENDREYAKEIVSMLRKKDSDGNLLIDAVVVLIDGSSRDLKTTYEIIEQVIAPYLGDNKRIVLAINQCDMGLKGRYWDEEKRCPEKKLTDFLNKKVESVQERVKASTGIDATPIYYSAFYKYNISKLLLAMMKAVPATKRFVYADNLNKNPEVWRVNDSVADYNREIKIETQNSLLKALGGALKGAKIGAAIGSVIPIVGEAIGSVVGGVLGFIGSFF